jgi:formate hydrogenlyase subunit 6/NADH:ubiquinone oxidoreductase subunit I
MDRGTRETLRRPYLKNERHCIACAFCQQACPVDAITMSDKNEFSPGRDNRQAVG